MTGKPRRSGWTGWVIGLLILLPLLWVGYWYTVQRIASAAIERATTAPVAGGRLGCVGQSLGGFPLRINFGCQRATFADGQTGTGEAMAAELGGLKASAPLYWPGYVEAELTSPFVVNAPALGLAITTSWSIGTAIAEAGLNGLQSASAAFRSLDFDNRGDTAHLPVRSFKADAAEVSAAPAGGRAYRVAAVASGLTMVRGDGRGFPKIDGEVRLTALNFGDTLGTDPGRALLEWLRAGGTANVQRLRFAASGASADADGHLTLSPQGVVSGALVVRMRNLPAFVDLAEAVKPGSRDNAAQAVSILVAMSVPVATPDGPARQTTLVIRDGLVSIGLVPVGIIPALRF